jgi:hypothetical protein
LKDQLASLKNGSSAITTSPVEGSSEELAAKLLAYQQFMAKYIVKSQEDKTKAIKAAEQATAKKYEEKMAFLLGSSRESISSTPADSATPVMSDNQALYQKRNAAVSEAAKAGKSRWGDKEAQRAAAQQVGGASVASPAVETPAASSVLSGDHALYQKRNEAVSEAAKAGKSRWGDLEVQRAAESSIAVTSMNGDVAIEIPPEVEKADHGMRADGGVGGPSLAERVAMGAAVVSVTPDSSATPVLSANQALYQKRNAMVSAAAKAGKSRWGDMEVQKATELASVQPASAAVSPQVVAADHGLRADGSVGGPSLAQRVNLGAQLLNSM